MGDSRRYIPSRHITTVPIGTGYSQLFTIFVLTYQKPMKPVIEIWKKGRFTYKKIVSDLFTRIIKDASRNAIRFIENTNYTTFLYGERQMNSILAPAFHKHTDAIVLEYPSTRKIGSKNHKARADYYCYCHDGSGKGYRLFVELKSNWQRLPLSKGFNKVNIELYNEACNQIKGLINEIRGKNKAFYSGESIIRASMISIALNTPGTYDKEIDFDEVIKVAANDFTYDTPEMDCNFIALWKIDEETKKELRKHKEWEDDNYTLHGILYVCHIMKPYDTNNKK